MVLPVFNTSMTLVNLPFETRECRLWDQSPKQAMECDIISFSVSLALHQFVFRTQNRIALQRVSLLAGWAGLGVKENCT